MCFLHLWSPTENFETYEYVCIIFWGVMNYLEMLMLLSMCFQTGIIVATAKKPQSFIALAVQNPCAESVLVIRISLFLKG